jgi:hypothetical protein
MNCTTTATANSAVNIAVSTTGVITISFGSGTQPSIDSSYTVD